MAVMIDEEDKWEVFFCLDAWDFFYERLAPRLPPWTVLRRYSPSMPLKDQVGNATVLIPTTAEVGADVIAAAPKLKLIVQPASGTDNICLEAAAARGIPVCTGAGLNASIVAEAALGTILMLARRVPEALTVFQQGGLGYPAGMLLHGKTLGIIGAGAIGSYLANIAEVMGMKVLKTYSHSPREALETLLRDSHVISIHCPLTPATNCLIGRAELAMTCPGVLIVNYGRGPVIDKEALLEGLESGHVGGAGLDVHWVEPADPCEPIYRHPRVVATPHTGTATVDLIDMYAEYIAENIAAVREGGPLRNQLGTAA